MGRSTQSKKNIEPITQTLKKKPTLIKMSIKNIKNTISTIVKTIFSKVIAILREWRIESRE